MVVLDDDDEDGVGLSGILRSFSLCEEIGPPNPHHETEPVKWRHPKVMSVTTSYIIHHIDVNVLDVHFGSFGVVR